MSKDKKSSAKSSEPVEGEDPVILLQNYKKWCNTIQIPIHQGIVNSLSNVEKYPIKQVIIDDEFGSIGCGGTRAFMTALMGSGPGMKGGIYKLISTIRFWRSNIGDEGTAAISEILRLGGGDIKIQYLELIDNNITNKGCNALGTALSYGNNLSLLTLKLNYNTEIGTLGIINLCKGLRTNCTLKQLHLQACGIGPDGGTYLADVLAYSRSNIEVFNISSNKLGGQGFYELCKGLMVNTKCETLNISDNYIENNDIDYQSLSAFRDCLLNPLCGLASVDLSCNRIGEFGAEILVPALSEDNTKVKEFVVDMTLPMDVFQKLFRKPSKKGKKGKKKGGGKKKKK